MAEVNVTRLELSLSLVTLASVTSSAPASEVNVSIPEMSLSSLSIASVTSSAPASRCLGSEIGGLPGTFLGGGVPFGSIGHPSASLWAASATFGDSPDGCHTEAWGVATVVGGSVGVLGVPRVPLGSHWGAFGIALWVSVGVLG